MTDSEAASWLAEAWQVTLSAAPAEADSVIDELCESKLVSVRYALITQLLGKYADHRRDPLCLQRAPADGALEEGRWDPRSFCTAVVVPWVQANDNVLGSSSDPYVNKPLRRRRLDDWSVALRNRATWEQLVALLSEVHERNEPAHTEATLRRCVASIARLYAKRKIAYAVPHRVSVEQCELAFGRFIAEASGGEAPQIAATALFRIIGQRFALFDAVARQGINEADSPSGVPGDIQCYLGEPPRIVLSVEVKDRDLTLIELNASIAKARRAGITEILFAAPSIADADAEQARERIRAEWAQGTNVYRRSLPALLHVTLALMGETARVALLKEVGSEINESATQPELRARWAAILDSIAL